MVTGLKGRKPAQATTAAIVAPWTCEDCGHENSDERPLCEKCRVCERPDLLPAERFLTHAVMRTVLDRDAWLEMRQDSDPPDGRMLTQLLTALGNRSGHCLTVEGPACWTIEGLRVRFWPDLREPPADGEADFDGPRLVSMLREIFRIPDPEQAASDAGGEGPTAAETPPAKKSRRGGVRVQLSDRVGEPPRPGASATAGENPAAAAQLLHLPVDRVVPSRHNPREEFDPEALEALAATIRAHGILEPLIVRPAGPDGSHELLAGERRLRAGQLAGLSVVPCVVRACDEPEAAKIRLIENFLRQDLNPIEEAKAFLAITSAGVTQRELAQELKLSQPQIANRMRLLDLPEAWRQRVISREISASAARVLAVWGNRPAVLDAVESLRADRLRWHRGYEPTVTDFEEFVERAIDQCTRSMERSKHAWEGGALFAPTPEQLAALDVVELRDGKTTTRVAFNVALWDELQNAAKAKADERRAKKAEKNGTAAAAKNGAAEPSPDERKRKTEQQWKQLNEKVFHYRTRWYQQQIGVRLAASDDASLLIRCVLYFAVAREPIAREGELMRAIEDRGGKAIGHRCRDYRTIPKVWAALATVAPAKLDELLRSMAVAWWQHAADARGSDVDPEDVEALAVELGADLKQHWRVDREFLQLFTKDQLGGLAKEWNLSLPLILPDQKRKGSILNHVNTIENAKRGDVIDALLKVDDGLRAKKKWLPAPKCLLKAKG